MSGTGSDIAAGGSDARALAQGRVGRCGLFDCGQAGRVGRPERNHSDTQPNKWKRQQQIFAIHHNGVDYFPGYGLDPGGDWRPCKALNSILEVFGDEKDGWGWPTDVSRPTASWVVDVRRTCWRPSHSKSLLPPTTRWKTSHMPKLHKAPPVAGASPLLLVGELMHIREAWTREALKDTPAQ